MRLQGWLPGRRWLPVLAWLFVLGLTAWVVAGFVLRFSLPPPQQARWPVVTDPQEAVKRVLSRGLIGPSAASTPVTADDAAPPVAAATLQGLNLVGVATAFGDSPGFALIARGNAPAQPFVVGDAVDLGVTLVALGSHHVELERAGVRSRLVLTRASAPSTSVPAIVGRAQR